MEKEEKRKNGFTTYRLDHDIYAALNGYGDLMRDIDNEYSTLKILKFAPIFFINEEDQQNESFIFGNLLRIWLIFNNGKYHVFLNNHIRSYYSLYHEHRIKYRYDYDVSYPVLRSFETEEEAIEFYNKVKELTDAVAIKEPITKMFNASDMYGLFNEDSKLFICKYCEFVDSYEKTIYYFNECQQFAVLLHKYDYYRHSKEKFYIILNRKIEIEFETEEDRDNCWEFLVDFYDQFEEDEIPWISTQRFLPNFLDELAKRSKKVEHAGKDTYYRTNCLICYYKGYKIACRIYSVCSGDMDMKFILSKDKNEISEITVAEINNICDLKKLLREKFPKEAWMKKYF